MTKRMWTTAVAVGVSLCLMGGGAASAQSIDPACRQGALSSLVWLYI